MIPASKARLVLIGALVLSTLMPLMAAFTAIFRTDQVPPMFGIAASPDVAVLAGFFGVAVAASVLAGAYAIIWTVQRKPEGLYLARGIGWFTLGSGFVILLKLHVNSFAAVDLVKGSILIVLGHLTPARPASR